MVSAIVRWIKDRLGISALERENVMLAKAILSTREECQFIVKTLRGDTEDHEARIAFLENSLTAKATTAKIVPKPANWKQFRSAAEKASEAEVAE